jgi:colanic acid biosynthesis glycosyl transferase WcaI
MNIMIVVNNFPPRINSAAHLYYELSESLKEKGHNVTVITEVPDIDNGIDKERKFKNKVFYSEDMNGIKVNRVPALSFLRRGSVGKALRFLLACFVFATRGILSRRADVILVFSPELYMGISGYIIAKIKRIPVVLNIQDIHPKVLIDLGILANPFIIKLFLAMEYYSYKNAHYIIVYSKGNKEYLRQKGVDPDKIFIVPNWTDTELITVSDRMNEFRRAYNLGEKFIVSYAGSMQRAQGLETIVEAAVLLKLNEDIVFLLVGDGESKPLLQKEIRDKKTNNVILLPLQPKEKYISVLTASDVHLLPLSKALPPYEVPGKLSNLMASGRPIVASVNPDGDAAKIIRQAGCGYCVEPGESTILSRAIFELYKNKKMRQKMGQNARRYAEKKFSRARCVNRFEEVLRNASVRWG